MNAVCPLCGNTDVEVVHRRGRGGEPLLNVICCRCGLVFTANAPGDRALTELYQSGSFSEMARGGRHPARGQLEASEKRALERYRRMAACLDIGSVKPRTAVDIGAGAGAFVRLARGAGFDAYGLEPDAIYAGTAASRYGVRIVPATLDQHSLEPASLGLATAFHVLEHVRDPIPFLKALRAAIHDQGVLWIEVPSLDRAYGGDLDHFFWAPHVVSYSSATLTAVLQRAGFDVMHEAEVGHFLEVAARPATPSMSDGEDAAQRLRDLARLRRRHRLAVATRPARARAARLGNATRRWAHRIARKSPNQATLPLLAGRHAPVVLHVAPHRAGNAGDIVLVDGVQHILHPSVGSPVWKPWDLGTEMRTADIAEINRTVRSVVVGGGGLFLRDTNPNELSGWQWQIGLEALDKLDVPLVVFAVGYNRFPGQGDFARVFDAHVAATVERASFIGLRNHGSIQALSRHLPSHLADRLRYQPCPTTVAARWASDVVAEAQPDERLVVLNPAFDRPDLRFGAREDEINSELACAMKILAREGFSIEIAVHSYLDATIVPWLDRFGVPYTERRLEGGPTRAVLEYYARAGIVIGMRGHSQMIPFGLGRPIVSVISHPKLGWFLDDIGHPEWGVDVSSSGLADQLATRVGEIHGNRFEVSESILGSQDRLWRITGENLELIADVLQ